MITIQKFSYVAVITSILLLTGCSSKKDEPAPAQSENQNVDPAPAPSVATSEVAPESAPTSVPGNSAGLAAPSHGNSRPSVAPRARGAVRRRTPAPAPVPGARPGVRSGSAPAMVPRPIVLPAPSAAGPTPNATFAPTEIVVPTSAPLSRTLPAHQYSFLDYSGNDTNRCWNTATQRPRSAAGTCAPFVVTLHCRQWTGTEEPQGYITIRKVEAKVYSIQVRSPQMNITTAQKRSMCQSAMRAGAAGQSLEVGTAATSAFDVLSSTRHVEDQTVSGLVLPPRVEYSTSLAQPVEKFSPEFFRLCALGVGLSPAVALERDDFSRWVRQSVSDFCGAITESWIVPQCVAPLFQLNSRCESACERLTAGYNENRTGLRVQASQSNQNWLSRVLQPTLTANCSASATRQLVAKQDLVTTVSAQTTCSETFRRDVSEMIRNFSCSSSH